MAKAPVVFLVLLFVAVAAVWGVVLFDPFSSKTHSITGTMTLTDNFDRLASAGCYGTDGYDDIRTGTAVTVKNEKGTLIGSGSLDPGVLTQAAGAPNRCVFQFEVAGVKDADFFQVEVSRRGGLTYSKAELAGRGWVVEAAL